MHRHTTPTVQIQMLLKYLLPLLVTPATVATSPVTTSALTSHQVGEAVDQIKQQAKKHARRMSLAVRRKSEPPKPKDE